MDEERMRFPLWDSVPPSEETGNEDDDDNEDLWKDVYQGFEVGTRITVNPIPGRPPKTGVITRIEALPNDPDHVDVWVRWISEN